ncbi:MAG TPA: protein-L-isoaspartate(D-aspartate) O-methyltransferase [Dehalococcoidales bacterium]|nr:protein-L-isoaspartate(D-aspartate) O-methyltransferase [Dehalococcoidales bacterium]
MDLEAARASLIEHLSAEIKDKRVLSAMSRIPRERFVPPESQHLAYEDIPLPIGLGQTISQPFIIALMTEALELTGSEKVLEVGTGSGYQSAILAELTRLVVTVERLSALFKSARQVLADLGYSNVEVHLAGETLGWLEGAPYDAIIVTAAAPKVPTGLLAQLAVGGRLVIPVGSRYLQELYKITKRKRKNSVENLGGCRFVSLIGRGAWDE